MKYFVAARPGPMPPSPEQFDAAIEWLDGKLQDGTLDFDGQRYIVAPRGETQWVRNLRASGEGRLRRGSRVEEFTATELADEDKMPLLRAYLKKWAWEVGAFFQGVGADAPDEDLRRIAPLHPIFRISRLVSRGGDRSS